SSVAITLRLPHEVVTLLGLPAALAFGHLRYGDNVCGGAEPEHDRTTGTHERQAPLDRGRRPCERLRERHTVHIRLLLLGATPDHARIRPLVGCGLSCSHRRGRLRLRLRLALGGLPPPAAPFGLRPRAPFRVP